MFALRAEFLFLSFPKEKETKKKGNLRACALKNSPIVQTCYAQSKTTCLFSPQLRDALRRLSGGETCTKQETKERKVGRPSVARRVCIDITSNAPEPPALDRRSQCNLNRSSQCLKEKARCARYADIKFRACAYACAHAHTTPSERLRLKGCADRIGAIRRITRSDAYARGGAIGIAVVIKTIFHVAGDSANMIGNIRRQKRIVKKSVAHVFPSDF